jgi:hypothetical protein
VKTSWGWKVPSSGLPWLASEPHWVGPLRKTFMFEFTLIQILLRNKLFLVDEDELELGLSLAKVFNPGFIEVPKL